MTTGNAISLAGSGDFRILWTGRTLSAVFVLDRHLRRLPRPEELATT
ncbi:hypothetical protein Afil01_24870 [Actinorhabdospora filicis]|uniref:Uncharacterized protein n=1 Tax=Actinorhabdospora filicis TaxID=1785913 RepID=A0A9W6SIG2_9ACTN|nr:hypothetical protein [Actinorhabdospora filicis]GLZ77680.1 hypothetical protein Afil01_24870 [Actinorhabdospora filicis]